MAQAEHAGWRGDGPMHCRKMYCKKISCKKDDVWATDCTPRRAPSVARGRAAPQSPRQHAAARPGSQSAAPRRASRSSGPAVRKPRCLVSKRRHGWRENPTSLQFGQRVNGEHQRDESRHRQGEGRLTLRARKAAAVAGSCVIGCPANTVRTISGHVTPISGLVSNACELSAGRCRVNEPESSSTAHAMVFHRDTR